MTKALLDFFGSPLVSEKTMPVANLRGKVVLTTGASSGIGAAIAKEAALRGAVSILVSRNAEKLENIESVIRARGGTAKSYSTDVTLAENCERLRASIEKSFGVPDIVINNAATGRWSYLDETSYAEIDKMIDAPLRAALYVTRAFLPALMARGAGAIGNVSSIACYLPWCGATAYTTQGWAMRGFNEALRADFKGTKLSATLLACATVDTVYFKKNQTRKPVTSKFIPVLKADDVAREYLDAIIGQKPFLVLPRGLELFRRVSFLFPKLVAGAMEKGAGKPRTWMPGQGTFLAQCQDK
jgi:short-subunit dehydrogenase